MFVHIKHSIGVCLSAVLSLDLYLRLERSELKIQLTNTPDALVVNKLRLNH